MAATTNDDVMQMVREAVEENDSVTARDLKPKAEEIDADVEDLTLRQFNARYLLQVKRMLAQQTDGGDGRPTAGSEDEAEGGEEEPTRQRILSTIEETLRSDGDAGTEELQEKAAEIDPDVAELTARQFHARYPLQVKRKLRREREEAAPAAASGGEESSEVRSHVRDVLLQFGRDVAGAEDRGELVDVITSTDEYVDRILEKAGA